MRPIVTVSLCLVLASAVYANMYQLHGPTLFVADKPVRFVAESNSPSKGDVVMAFDERYVREKYEEQLRGFEETMEEKGQTMDDFRMGLFRGDTEGAIDTEFLQDWSAYDTAGLGHSTTIVMNTRGLDTYQPGQRYFFMVCRQQEEDDHVEYICNPNEGMVAVTSDCTAEEVVSAVSPFFELLNDADLVRNGDQLAVTKTFTERLESLDNGYAEVEAKCPELLGRFDKSDADMEPGELLNRMEECNTEQCRTQSRFLGAAHLSDKENLRIRANSLALLRTVLMENFRNRQRRMDALGVDAASGRRLRRNIQGLTMGRADQSARLRDTQRLNVEDPLLESSIPFVDEDTFGVHPKRSSGDSLAEESSLADQRQVLAALQLAARTEGGFGDLLWTAGKFAVGMVCAPVTITVGAVETVNHAVHGRWSQAAVGTLSTAAGAAGYILSAGTAGDLGSQVVDGAATAIGIATTAGAVVSAGAKIAHGDY